MTLLSRIAFLALALASATSFAEPMSRYRFAVVKGYREVAALPPKLEVTFDLFCNEKFVKVIRNEDVDPDTKVVKIAVGILLEEAVYSSCANQSREMTVEAGQTFSGRDFKISLIQAQKDFSTTQVQPTHRAEVNPASSTRVETFHVKAENLPIELQNELQSALQTLGGKCWDYSTAKERAVTETPATCVRFVPFTTIEKLKPFKRVATEEQMVLTALDQPNKIGVQNFVWDGAKLQRVRNSFSWLPEKEKSPDRLADFLVSWAFK